MSAKTRFHRHNPKKAPTQRLLHCCGRCLRGGGTLKKEPGRSADGMPYLYVHTEARFCKATWKSKRVLAAAIKIQKILESRAKQAFNSRRGNAPQNYRQKAG